MQTREWTFCDKTAWGNGPWLHEPDKLQWPDPATGLPCLIVRNDQVTGALCGYVGVPPGHSLHGKRYDDAQDLEVHGGLNFADSCRPRQGDQGICHLAEPGEPDDIWWFGFHCSRVGDLSPKLDSMDSLLKTDPILKELHASMEALHIPGETYRDLDYVKAQVTSLAAQLAALV